MTEMRSRDPMTEYLGHQSGVTAEDRFDRWGAFIGVLCAVHCALTPISLILAPIFGIGLLWTDRGEFALLGLALLCTAPSMLSARKYQNGVKIISLFVLSWVILIGAKSIEHLAHNERGAEKTALVVQDAELQTENKRHEHDLLNLSLAVLGGLGLAAAHTLNLRARRELHKSCCST